MQSNFILRHFIPTNLILHNHGVFDHISFLATGFFWRIFKYNGFTHFRNMILAAFHAQRPGGVNNNKCFQTRSAKGPHGLLVQSLNSPTFRLRPAYVPPTFCLRSRVLSRGRICHGQRTPQKKTMCVL